MDKEQLKTDFRAQINVCERTIEQNLGVIQFCKAKLAELEKPEEPVTPPAVEGEQK